MHMNAHAEMRQTPDHSLTDQNCIAIYQSLLARLRQTT